MTAAAPAALAAQRPVLAALAVAVAALGMATARFGADRVALLAIGLALGFVLYRGAFGFAAAYRHAIAGRDVSHVLAQVLMLAVAVVLFAPVLAAGTAFGRPVTGAVAPVGVAMALGAFLFGIGMQLGSGCASGTLYTAGSGSVRMMIVLACFSLGGFWGSLDLHRWQRLPAAGTIDLGDALGWPAAVVLQLAVLAAAYIVLRRLGASSGSRPWPARPGAWLLRGPWPPWLAALALALLNWLTLLVAGHPWVVTWGLTLWSAKVAVALGWDPASSPFWDGGFADAALARPVLADSVSVMNIGVILGASIAAALAGRLGASLRLSPGPVAAAVVGGLLMGYGARLSYGCNIGAFFSGIASGSLHGWVWIACALAGTVIGIRLRPRFRLAT